MKFLPGTITLGQITGGTLNSGTIPAPRFTRFLGSAENAANVTVPAAGVTIVSLDCGTVFVGDLILVSGKMALQKGAAQGNLSLNADKDSGTAVVQENGTNSFATMGLANVGNSNTQHFNGFAIYEVTTGGTLVMKLRATSQAIDSTLLALNGELKIWIIAGS